MKKPDPEFEKKILRDVVEQMRDTDATERKQSTLRRVIFGLGYAGLLIAFFVAINSLVPAFTSAFIAAVSGSAIGFALFLRFASKQWPITRQHIDMDSVRRRLDELEKDRLP